jgi:hypothetical protein
VAQHSEHVDPFIALIEDEKQSMTFDEWRALLRTREPVVLGISAAELLEEAREAGEV